MSACDLWNAALHQSRWTRIECSDSKLIGARANESSWKDVHLDDCVADALQLQQSKCQEVRFSRSRLRGATFTSTDLTGTAFDACNLREADFSNAVLSGVDPRRSKHRANPDRPQVAPGSNADAGPSYLRYQHPSA